MTPPPLPFAPLTVALSRSGQTAAVDDSVVGPICLLDGGDVQVVIDPADVPRYIEPFMADEPIELFDGRARRLRILTEGTVRRRRFWTVDSRSTVSVALLDNIQHADHLRAAITSYLTRTGKSVPQVEDIHQFTAAAAALIE